MDTMMSFDLALDLLAFTRCLGAGPTARERAPDPYLSVEAPEDAVDVETKVVDGDADLDAVEAEGGARLARLPPRQAAQEFEHLAHHAVHRLELVLGGKHADKHDPPTSNVLCAALQGF